MSFRESVKVISILFASGLFACTVIVAAYFGGFIPVMNLSPFLKNPGLLQMLKPVVTW